MRKSYQVSLRRMELDNRARQMETDIKLMKIKANQDIATREAKLREHFRKLEAN